MLNVDPINILIQLSMNLPERHGPEGEEIVRQAEVLLRRGADFAKAVERVKDDQAVLGKVLQLEMVIEGVELMRSLGQSALSLHAWPGAVREEIVSKNQERVNQWFDTPAKRLYKLRNSDSKRNSEEQSD